MEECLVEAADVVEVGDVGQVSDALSVLVPVSGGVDQDEPIDEIGPLQR